MQSAKENRELSESTRIKLEMGRTCYRLGLRENARQYFEEVLAARPPSAVK
jgi:hypothetical protein